MKMIFFASLIFSLTAVAAVDDKKLEALKGELAKSSMTDPMINEFVKIKPVKDHHFNLEAPQKCGDDATIDKSALEIKCQFHSSGERKVTVSVCDDKKVYCRQEYFQIAVKQQTSGTPRMMAPLNEETQKAQKEFKKKLMKGFKVSSIEEAKTQAKGKKATLVVVSTEWCPPCNVVKEFLFPTKEFAEATKDVQLVYVDGDDKASQPWMKKLGTKYYPTFVLLNDEFESMAFFAGDIETHSFKKWLNTAVSQDRSLDAAIEHHKARIGGGLVAKAKDLFKSAEQIENEFEQILDSLDSLNRNKESLELMKLAKNDQFKYKILSSELSQLDKDEEFKKLDKELQKSKKKEMRNKLLSGPVDKIPYYFYEVSAECKVKETKEGEEEQKLNPKCSEYFAKALKSVENYRNEDWDKLNKTEQALRNANALKYKAYVNKLEGKKEESEKLYSECRTAFDGIFAMSPLKEKSRSVRFSQLSCMGKGGDGEQAIATLKSLTKDYPYDETFHRKLARKYRDAKKYDLALAANEKAVKYSYGNMWAYNIVERVRILKAMKQNKKAFSLLEDSMAQFSLDKDDKSWVVSSARKEYEKLKKELNL